MMLRGMKQMFAGGTATTLLLLFVTGCTDKTPAPHSEARRDTDASGDCWRATTHVPITRGPKDHFVSVEESVCIDSTGKLISAEVAYDRGSRGKTERVLYDFPGRSIVVDHDGTASRIQVSGDEPWILPSAVTPSGERVVTPLVAWVTYRAARGSEWVRPVFPDRRRSYVAPRDQFLIDQVVIIDDDAVEVDDRFVQSWLVGGVALERRSSGLTGPFRFEGRI